MVLHPDSLLISQSQQLVVVHNRVHIFNPQRIDVTVKEYIFTFIPVAVQWPINFTKDIAQEAIRPIASCRLQRSIQFNDSAGLDRCKKEKGGFIT